MAHSGKRLTVAGCDRYWAIHWGRELAPLQWQLAVPAAGCVWAWAARLAATLATAHDLPDRGHPTIHPTK